MLKKVQKKKISHKKFAIVVSRFNEFITKRLLDGCLEEFLRNGIKKEDVLVVWVAGAWEIPVVSLKLARCKNICSVVCLGAIIRGETSHFDFVAQGACNGIQQVALLTGKPIILGVLTTDTIRQAEERAKIKGNNKGREAALTALETVRTLRSC